MCMEEGQGVIKSMSEVDGLGLGLRHVSSMSTTLWFVEEGVGAGDWEGELVVAVLPPPPALPRG